MGCGAGTGGVKPRLSRVLRATRRTVRARAEQVEHLALQGSEIAQLVAVSLAIGAEVAALVKELMNGSDQDPTVG